ncbi:hypothetical protein E8E11_001691 [Didymella keratinophila]|nr:hypothetical protein E8E11_001691 [Didymella keratinophila]
MATKKPTIVLIPGSFLHSSHYTPTLQPLIDAGISIHVLDPPCYHTKKPGPPPTMYDDAFFIAKFVEGLADQGEEVVLVSHSYGGTPASEAVKELSVTERRKSGKKGGVVMLAFVTAVVPKDGWLVHTDLSATVDTCFNSISKEEGTKHCKAAIGQHSSLAFGGEASTLRYPGYRNVPVSWFLCEDDRCVVPEVQETAIRVIEESWKGTEREETKVDVTRVNCDHFPTLSAQGKLREWFGGLVEKRGR